MTEQQKLIKQLDVWFSRYIRLRDCDKSGFFVCISCGAMKKAEQSDCGHYINRKHMSLRFSEINCNAQCRECNRFDEGNMSGYRRGMVFKYGENQTLMVESMKNQAKKWSCFELEALIDHYKRKVKELRKQKPQLNI